MYPRWTSSAKDAVGTSMSELSRVWFTISHGIVNEVYYPRVDIANTRDLQFLVAGPSYFSEERKDTEHSIEMVEDGIPVFSIRNTAKDSSYVIEKTVMADPEVDVLLQHVRFEPRDKGLTPYVLLAPHIMNGGYGNTAWVSEYKGIPALFAQKGPISMALLSSTGFTDMSVGFVGISDPWQDISRNHSITWKYTEAHNGNVAMGASLGSSREFVLALGFGETPSEAALKARNSLQRGFQRSMEQCIRDWRRYYEGKDIPHVRLGRISASVLRVHEAKSQFRGAIIASLSIPWGNSKSDDDMGGYHLVWPRDMVEAAMALHYIGDDEGAVKALEFLRSTQEPDGHWYQNLWLDGSGYWSGVQMDETAFPILLADLLRRSRKIRPADYWDMVRRACSFIVTYGPVTQQDRWEENGGYSPFTLAVEVAALIAGSEFAEELGKTEEAQYMRDVADFFNSNIERWTYVSGTDLAREVGVSGYYVRISPPDTGQVFAPSAIKGYVPVKNRPPGSSEIPAEEIVSTDALALVRFGLRSPADQRVVDTVKVIDRLLRTETRTGPVWHRYNHDGYGEHDDGSPFDGTGTGRGWPLLAGERGHYELASGNAREAMALLQTMEAQASPGGMIPEQVWDSDDIPQRGLYNGKPSGSAMPLAWAHAEYLKLALSIERGRVMDMPLSTYRRYVRDRVQARLHIWTFYNRSTWMPRGKVLRVQCQYPFVLHSGHDGWKDAGDIESRQNPLGVHYVDIEPGDWKSVEFTFFWPAAGKWEGQDFALEVRDGGL